MSKWRKFWSFAETSSIQHHGSPLDTIFAFLLLVDSGLVYSYIKIYLAAIAAIAVDFHSVFAHPQAVYERPCPLHSVLKHRLSN